MSSRESESAIELVPRASGIVRTALVALHGIAAAVTVWCAMKQPWLWLVLPVIALHLRWSYRRFGRLEGSGVVRRVIWRRDGSWQIGESGAGLREARLLAHSFLHPALLVLNFRRLDDGARRVVVLCRDSESEAVLRRLRRRLYLRAASA